MVPVSNVSIVKKGCDQPGSAWRAIISKNRRLNSVQINRYGLQTTRDHEAVHKLLPLTLNITGWIQYSQDSTAPKINHGGQRGIVQTTYLTDCPMFGVCAAGTFIKDKILFHRLLNGC